MTKAYFITGTDTDIGKTYIAALLIDHFVSLGHKTIAMKPISAGCEMLDGQLKNEDALKLLAASNINAPYSLVNPYAFAPAIAPHIAANLAGETIGIALIQAAYTQLTALADVVIVEGAGGFLVPINESETIADLSAALSIPVVLVVGMRLGCINHALLTVLAIEQKGLKLAGWIANEVDTEMPYLQENIASLVARINAPYLGFVAWRRDAGLDEVYSQLNLNTL